MARLFRRLIVDHDVLLVAETLVVLLRFHEFGIEAVLGLVALIATGREMAVHA